MRTLSAPLRRRSPQGGFTLIEVMIVVVIISLLATIAYPSYTQFVMRSKRQAAKNMLYTIADRQEQFYQDNKIYAANLSTLGFEANTIGLDNSGERALATATDLTYVLDLVDATATTYTVQAVPKNQQAARDTDCATLTLTQAGERTQSGDGQNCW
jgi:type IV pilus assembly protein PilE